MLSYLSDHLVIVVLAVLTLLLLVLLAFVASAALRGGTQEAGADGGARQRLLGSESLRQSFRNAVALIEANLATRSERYSLSWTLLLNDSAGRDVPLLHSGLQSALSADSSMSAAAEGMVWNFFDRGVVVQLQSEHLGSPDPDSGTSTGVWDDFLGLCRAYRPQRPFDAIVLAVPCALMLAADPQGQLDLVARAKAIHRRLWLAQNRLALRLPIHLVITECDVLPGFSSFGAALPESMQRAMLGWASPYELVAPFRAQWVDAAVDQIGAAVADGCAELAALAPAGDDSAAYFLLPGEIARLRAGLAMFCEELMRPSAYHEPFLLRGMYLTGDASEAAVLMASGRHDPATVPAFGKVAPELNGAATGAGDGTGAGASMPVFLRDIFERKIFAEVGLVQASSQRLRRPALNRYAYVAGWALPLGWAIGLGVATYQLQHLGADLRGYLHSTNDAQGGTAAAGSDNRQRVLDVLISLGQLNDRRFGSVFMPGSWSLVDDLHERVQTMLEKDFARHAYQPLRRAADGKLADLTGAPLDPSGLLIGVAECSVPAGWSGTAAAPAPHAINLEDLPQYRAMLSYLERLERINEAVAALRRLRDNGPIPPSGDDLTLVVRVLLDAELHGTASRTAALFRETAGKLSPPPLAPMQQAARCSLRKASDDMYRRLFDENTLMKSEKTVMESSRKLLDPLRRDAVLHDQLEQWNLLRAALDAQQGQLAPGKGAWMNAQALSLGASYNDLMGRIGANALLGPEAKKDSQERAGAGFARMSQTWQAMLKDPNPIDAGSTGLWWDNDKASWASTPERSALRETLATMMTLPYMKEVALAHLPELPPRATASWDKPQLERAANMADARKAFQTGPYLQLPTPLQQPAATMVDQALAASIQGMLAQAMSVSTSSLPSAASDAERVGVLRVRGLLEELRAQLVIAELDAALARDAYNRLLSMDELFTRAQVFVPRDRWLSGWQGKRGPLLDAYAVDDANELNAYVAQQLEFVTVAGKQIDGVMAQLGGANADDPIVARWKAIGEELQRYRLRSPTSSLVALEQFMHAGSAELDLGTCGQRGGARPPARRAADVFAERLAMLQGAVQARCRELAANRYRADWDRFAEAYNRDLGSRLPFAGQAGAMPADLDEVGAALKLYERARGAATAAAEREAGPAGAGASAGASAGVGATAARQTEQQLRRVREVLAPLYPSEDGQAGGLDVTVQFRANTADEVEANKIIDWSLTIGTATLRRTDAPRPLRWEPGQPVLLALRLARDGAAAPRPEPGQPAMTVAERTVIYRFDDPWALFSLIAAQRQPGAPGADERATLLRFEFPITHEGAAALAQADARARVFLRLSVSPPGKRTPLAWPAVFPTQVPVWQELAGLGADAVPKPSQASTTD